MISGFSNSRRNNIVEVPYTKQRSCNASHCGRDHVRDGRSDFNGEQTSYAHQETNNTLLGVEMHTSILYCRM